MTPRLIALLGFNIILLAGGAIWRWQYEIRRSKHQLDITSLPSVLATAETSMHIVR